MELSLCERFRYQKMGQALSIVKELQVSLADYTMYTNDTYTVERTSGLLETGWRISPESRLMPYIDGPCASNQHEKEPGKWRVFMDNQKTAESYICGWRKIEKFEPTRLSGDAEAINAWRQDLIAVLDALEKERLTKMDPFPPGKDIPPPDNNNNDGAA
jgi:hypothetical protein